MHFRRFITFDCLEFPGVHGKNFHCTPGMPLLFAMHTRKLILSQRYAYLKRVIPDIQSAWTVYESGLLELVAAAVINVVYGR